MGDASRTRRVFLAADVRSTYVRGVLRGVAQYAREQRGRWEFRVHDLAEVAPAGSAAWDGAIAQIASERVDAAFSRSGVPTINISNRLVTSLHPRVVMDDHAVGRLAAEYFLGRGFRHFAFVGIERHRYSDLRYEGFRAAIPRDIPVAVTLHPRTTRRWLAELPRPIAVLACNDASGAAFIEQCLDAGLAVPDEVAVLGVDDDEIECELSRLPLSSVHLPTQRLGFLAAQILDRILSGRKPPTRATRVPPGEVVTRRSTDVQAIGDAEVAQAVRFIRDHSHEPISVGNVVAAATLSRRALELRFRSVLGRSPNEELRRVRLERARSLLAGGSLSIDAVARVSGFRDGYYLSRVFREEMGTTPSAYRRSLTGR